VDDTDNFYVLPRKLEYDAWRKEAVDRTQALERLHVKAQQQPSTGRIDTGKWADYRRPTILDAVDVPA
jgi:hypothetical protein